MPIDRYGRKIEYLRLSVTDRCNFQCAYCSSNRPSLPREKILSLEEIAYLAQTAYELGFKAVKLTGGEPMLRKNILWLIKRIAAIGYEDFSLTTNGYNLLDTAYELKKAGLQRVTVSIDSLSERTYSKLTGFKDLNYVLKGVERAIDVFGMIKINTVLIKGFNDREINKFVSLVFDKPIELRFIELVPSNGYNPMSLGMVRSYLESDLDMTKTSKKGFGPSETYKIRGAVGSLGFISLKEQAFCDYCKRLRIRADGKIKPCLYSKKEINVIEAIREGTEEDVKRRFFKAIHEKPKKHGRLITDMRENGG